MPHKDLSWRLFIAGIAVTIGNPKSITFYLSLLPIITECTSVTVVSWLELIFTIAAVMVVIDFI